ncbi:hypothetical protein NQ176_g10855 [Zarea fungicola]|uniref:Uncharacterized protein n=1 Tax=Zarea fungicola TaxID=93591 RepID=A0ACC1MDX4_9HYPO|nr:hypothetical protein NQ176_g10855 [Lecanicillium fungicola]
MNSLIYLVALTMGLTSKALAAQCNIFGDGDAFYRVFTAESTLDCMSGCVADIQCESSEYRADTRNCWLYDMPVSSAKKYDTPGGQWVFNDRDCLPESDFPECKVKGDGSHFYKTLVTGTMESCMQYCVADPDCRSSEYRAGDKKCWLYAMPVSQAKINDDPSGTWLMNDRNCPTPPAVQMCSVDGDGDDFYRQFKSKYSWICRQACRDDEKCESSAFKEQTGDCWLFSTRTEDAMTRPGAGNRLIFFSDQTCRINGPGYNRR